MDSLAKWSAHLVDLRTLLADWERRSKNSTRWTRRFREIHTACMFTLCMENGTDHRYLIGFQQPGIADSPVKGDQLFDDTFGEIEDCDILLVDDPKQYGESQVLHHRCQLVSYINQPSTSESDFIAFLERKKLKVPRDDDLRLVIHVEQEGFVNHVVLSLYLQHRVPACPYSQIFIFGQNGVNPRKWSCVQLFPELAIMPELDEPTAQKLIVDLINYNKPIPPENCSYNRQRIHLLY